LSGIRQIYTNSHQVEHRREVGWPSFFELDGVVFTGGRNIAGSQRLNAGET
jgi:hypothetical protein